MLRASLFACLVVSALTGLACGQTAEQVASASATASVQRPWPPRLLPADSLAPLRDTEVRREASRGIVTAARVLVPHVAPADGVTIALQWRGTWPSEPDLAPDADWQEAMLNGLRMRVRTPAGDEVVVEAAPRQADPSRQRAWFSPPNMTVLHVSAQGVRTSSEAGDRAWSQPAAGLFSVAGSYTLTLAGSLRAAAGDVPFETGELTVEVVDSPEHRTLAELERIAATELFGAGHVEEVLNGSGWIRRKPLSAVEDERGGRWLWFVARTGGGSGEQTDLHLNITAGGRVLAYDHRIEETCLAEGTRIATPTGDVPVERLQIGDEVLGWDEERAAQATTHVRAVVRRAAAPTILIDGLRLTGEHPIHRDGAWIDAREVRPGDLLRHRERGLIEVRAVTDDGAPSVVYDVSVGPPHNYFAGGLLVHNKVAPRPGPSDPWAFLLDRPGAPGWSGRKWWGPPRR